MFGPVVFISLLFIGLVCEWSKGRQITLSILYKESIKNTWPGLAVSKKKKLVLGRLTWLEPA